MNKTTKTFSVAVAMFAIVGMVGVFSNQAFANPPGVTPGAKLQGTANILVHPGEWVGDDLVCPNNGNSIFVADDGSGNIAKINYYWDPTVQKFDVTDCDATTDGVGEIRVADKAKSSVYLKLLGPKTSELDVLCEEIVDINDDENLCLIANQHMHRNGQGFVRIAQNAIADGLEGVAFDLQKVDGKVFKHLQLRSYIEP